MARGKQSIVIAEDYTTLREGLRALISSDPGFEVLAEAGDGREAIQLVEKLKPNLVLTDSSMPRINGMEAIREIRRLALETKIVVLTVHKPEEYILATFKAAYPRKDAFRQPTLGESPFA